MTAKDKINLNRNQVKQIIKLFSVESKNNTPQLTLLALTLFAALRAALSTNDKDGPLNFVLVSRLKNF